MTPADHQDAELAAPLGCSLDAFDPIQRKRYEFLRSQLRASILESRDTPGGYEFLLDSAVLSLPEVEEWAGLERLCCPFLSVDLQSPDGGAQVRLSLIGPEGVKPILKAALLS